MNQTPDVLEQVPAGGGMNKPASGTYGEKTELAQLQAELPIDQPAQGSQDPVPRPSAAPITSGAPTSAPAGLPKGLLAPTARPDVPVSAPLQTPVDPMAGAVDARQRRLRYLDLLSQSQEVSPEVREWADTVKKHLIARG